jgi:predicted ribosomally synthesized peptide with SipW-like signal peptide
MNKKSLLSIMVIAITSALLGAGTMAFLSDIEVSSGNVFNAGTLVLDVGGDPLPVIFEDMKPCTWDYVDLTVHVDNNADLYFHIFNVVDDGGIETEPELRADPTGLINDLSNHIDVDLSIDGTPIIWEDDHMKLGWIECVWFYVGPLTASETYALQLSFHLQDVGNEYQGDRSTFDFEILALQAGTNLYEYVQPSKILLENKDTTTWDPIKGDGLWGVCEYEVGSLNLGVKAKGLSPVTDYQIALNSPEVADWFPVDPTTRIAMASALASGVYDGVTPGTAPPAGYNLYERGYYPSAAPNLGTTYVDGDIGVYAWTKYGIGTTTSTTDSNGELEVIKSATLPSGEYSFIKVIVKLDDSPWTPVLMEERDQLFFTIP